MKSNALFPSTIDDIAKSQITRHTSLTLEELNAIRSLIGNAKSDRSNRKHPPESNSTNNSKLLGRRVMIPVTSKAFFEGVLEPPSDTSSNDDWRNEKVFIHVGSGNFEEVSRLDASEFFERKVAEIQSSVADSSDELQWKKIGSSTTKSKEEINHTKSKTSSDSADLSFGDEDDAQILPYMEIREECDSSGEIVRSEVINISKQMKTLNTHLKGSNAGDKISAKKFGEILEDALKVGECDHTLTESIQTTDEYKSPPIKNPLSDAEYICLRSRLEELEQLEAEDASAKAENMKSSKRLQSKGWSKGFLNTKPKFSSKNIASPSQRQQNTEQPKAMKSNPDSGDSKSNSRKVHFSTEVDIKQIPIIGQAKVSKQSFSSNSLNANVIRVPESDPFPPTASIPFGDNALKDVVIERSTPYSPSKNDEQKGADTNDGPVNKKKLSRFALQRQNLI